MDTDDINSCAKIRKTVKDIINHGTYYKKNFQNISPFIHFLESASNNGIQLSDAVAYSIRRFLRKKVYGLYSNIDQYNDNIFTNLIKLKFRNYPNFLGSGLKIYPNIVIGI